MLVSFLAASETTFRERRFKSKTIGSLLAHAVRWGCRARVSGVGANCNHARMSEFATASFVKRMQMVDAAPDEAKPKPPGRPKGRLTPASKRLVERVREEKRLAELKASGGGGEARGASQVDGAEGGGSSNAGGGTGAAGSAPAGRPPPLKPLPPLPPPLLADPPSPEPTARPRPMFDLEVQCHALSFPLLSLVGMKSSAREG